MAMNRALFLWIRWNVVRTQKSAQKFNFL